MKKVLSIVFSATLFLGVGSPAFAAEKDNVGKVLELIEKTNQEIDKKIEKAVEKADDLQSDYLEDVRKIEESKEIVKLKEEKEKVQSELNVITNDEKKVEKLSKKLFNIEEKMQIEQLKIENKILEIQQEIIDVTVQAMSTNEKDDKKLKEQMNISNKLNDNSDKYRTLTQEFTENLHKLITDIYDETFKMSAETIAKAAKEGVICECSWKLVRFADQWVWIDPVRVVKFLN